MHGDGSRRCPSPSPERRVVELRPPKRSAPKRRRKPAHRRRRRDEKRACSDTTEESISSTPPQRKRVRTYKGLPSNSFSHVTLADSRHFHNVVSHCKRQTSTSIANALRVRKDRWTGPGAVVRQRRTTVWVSMRAPGRTRTLFQHSMTAQLTGCFPSLCHVQHRTLGTCSQLFVSGTSKITPLMSGPSKPWELDPSTRRWRVRALLIQAALWAPTMNEKDAILEAMPGATGLGGLTSPSMVGRRGFAALTNAACCAVFKGSAGSSGEVATNASVQQHRDVGVPRNSQQQHPLSHHLATVIIISPNCSKRPPLHNLYVFAARYSSNKSLSVSLCIMSSLRSPMHFRVHAACRTASWGSKAPESLGRPLHPWDIPAPPLKRTTAMTWTSQCPTRAVSVGKRSSRLRRLKDTLLSNGAWQQVTRVEDLCHAQVSHK